MRLLWLRLRCLADPNWAALARLFGVTLPPCLVAIDLAKRRDHLKSVVVHSKAVGPPPFASQSRALASGIRSARRASYKASSSWES